MSPIKIPASHSLSICSRSGDITLVAGWTPLDLKIPRASALLVIELWSSANDSIWSIGTLENILTLSTCP